jgi:uridine phosphorylase
MFANAPPILKNKHHDAASIFSPGNLLREARRQKSLKHSAVPPVCILDPDGDIVRHLKAGCRATLDSGWACYHSELHRFHDEAMELGIVGCAVGAPFAVLVAEQLFEAGCRLLISMTSAGQLQSSPAPPFFIVIDRALRDEVTSYHYLSPTAFSHATAGLLKPVAQALTNAGVPAVVGATWTTDAPFRETQAAIDQMRDEGLVAVEMEAAALYAFAHARQKHVICFAHVTNQMGRVDGDFEKGEADGAKEALNIIRIAAGALQDVVLGSEKS